MDAPNPQQSLILYIRHGCPYCARVLAAGTELGISFSIKDIADWDTLEELEALGGKVQVPYLVDAAQSVALYEADDIIAHLHQTYGKDALYKKDSTSDNPICPV